MTCDKRDKEAPDDDADVREVSRAPHFDIYSVRRPLMYLHLLIRVTISPFTLLTRRHGHISLALASFIDAQLPPIISTSADAGLPNKARDRQSLMRIPHDATPSPTPKVAEILSA